MDFGTQPAQPNTPPPSFTPPPVKEASLPHGSSKKKMIILGIILFLLGTIPLVVYLALQQQETRNHAAIIPANTPIYVYTRIADTNGDPIDNQVKVTATDSAPTANGEYAVTFNFEKTKGSDVTLLAYGEKDVCQEPGGQDPNQVPDSQFRYRTRNVGNPGCYYPNQDEPITVHLTDAQPTQTVTVTTKQNPALACGSFQTDLWVLSLNGHQTFFFGTVPDGNVNSGVDTWWSKDAGCLKRNAGNIISVGGQSYPDACYVNIAGFVATNTSCQQVAPSNTPIPTATTTPPPGATNTPIPTATTTPPPGATNTPIPTATTTPPPGATNTPTPTAGLGSVNCTSLAVSPSSGPANTKVTLTGSGSANSAAITGFQFDFGDGNTQFVAKQIDGAGSASIDHYYPVVGTYVAKVQVKDNNGRFSDTPEACRQTITITSTGPTSPQPTLLAQNPVVTSPTPTPASLPNAGVSLPMVGFIGGGLFILAAGLLLFL